MRAINLAVATALLATAAAPVVAQGYDPNNNGNYQQGYDQRDAEHRDRDGDHRDGDHRDGDRRTYDRQRAQYERDSARYRQDNAQYQRDAADWRNGRRYDWNRPDPRANGYYADRYYRDGRYYQPRYLSANERIYAGNDGRYYCRRSDGTTGLIIGAVGGGVLGNAIAPGGSRTVSTLAGGVLGAILGQSVDSGRRVQCR